MSNANLTDLKEIIFRFEKFFMDQEVLLRELRKQQQMGSESCISGRLIMIKMHAIEVPIPAIVTRNIVKMVQEYVSKFSNKLRIIELFQLNRQIKISDIII